MFTLLYAKNLRFHVGNCKHADQKQLTRRWAFDLDIESTHGQPASCRARLVNVDDGLEDIMWTRGLGGEKLPAASYALLPNLKKGLFFAIGEGSRNFASCFLHSSAQMCLYQTPGRRPTIITGRFVNTVTRGWVGAPNEHAPFRFHGAVVDFVDRCLSRTRNLAASNYLSFVRPVLAQDLPRNYYFRFFLESCLLYTSPSPRDGLLSRMPSSA